MGSATRDNFYGSIGMYFASNDNLVTLYSSNSVDFIGETTKKKNCFPFKIDHHKYKGRYVIYEF